MNTTASHDNSIPTRCFLSISIAGGPPRRVEIELDTQLAPLACRNFVLLCDNRNSTTPSNPSPTYRGCIFHRVVPNFMVQSGDFSAHNGTGGYAALPGKYHGQTFPDENFLIKHDQAGIVSMANKGKDTNGSQFFVTLQPTPHLNGKHVAFGRVVSGLEVMQDMADPNIVELEGTRPISMHKIVIVDCGVVRETDGNNNGSGGDQKEDSKQKKIDHSKERKRHKESKGDQKDRKRRKKESKKEKDKKKHRRKQYRKEDKHSSDSSTSRNDDGRRERKRRKDKKRKKRRRDNDSSSESSSSRSSSTTSS